MLGISASTTGRRFCTTVTVNESETDRLSMGEGGSSVAVAVPVALPLDFPVIVSVAPLTEMPACSLPPLAL